MKINMLKEGYKKNKEFYQDFLNGTLDNYIDEDKEIFLENTIPDFPVYLGGKDVEQKKNQFLELINVININFKNINREILFDELFWHSYLCLYKRSYLLEKYPEIEKDESVFKNIVIKSFNWENYIYKAILAAQYVRDYIDVNATKEEYEKYYDLILDNLDVFNYIIKYEIFRNGNFLINILQIIEETGTSKILKSKIKDRPDLGKDERYGRRIIYEFNKSYPIILSPMLTKDQLKPYFHKFLGYYNIEVNDNEDVDDEF